MTKPAATRLSRFGVSLETDLLRSFDSWLAARGYPNRTEAFRELIRKELSQERWASGREAVGAIALVYDHHRPQLLAKLAHAQHDHPGLVLSAQHVHLSHHSCLEILAVRGQPARINALFAQIRGLKGIKRAALTSMGDESS